MKKSIRFMLLSLPLFVLASCGGSSNSKDVYDKGDWGVEDIKQNIVIDDKTAEKSIDYSVCSNIEFESQNIVNSDYAGNGLLVVKNTSNHIGFYSLLHNKYLIKCQYIEELLTYEVITNSNIGYFLRIVYDNKTFYYDSLGNLIYENAGNHTVQLTTTILDKKVYLNVNNANYLNANYLYKNDGSLSVVSEIPSNSQSNTNSNSKITYGDKYVDLNKLDLEEYGLYGYYLSKKNELITVFDDEKNSPVSTFTIPNDSEIMIVGKKLYYQLSYEVSEDSLDYSYFLNGTKYLVDSYCINIMDGEKEKVELNYLINKVIGPYKDSKGIYNRCLIKKQSFSNKVLKTSETVLVNSNGEIISNLNGYEPDSFIQLDTNFYNTSTKVLYNSKLEEIAYLGAINPSVIKNTNYIVGSNDGKYGLINSTGRVALTFDYDQILYQYATNNCVFATKDNVLYRLKLNDGYVHPELIGSNFKKINNYVYYVNGNMESTSKQLGYVYGSKNETCGNINSVLFDSTIMCSYNTSGTYKTYVTISNNKVPNYSTFSSIGTEIVEEEKLGLTYEDAMDLSIGDNKIYITSNSGNYCKFTPSVNGYYTIDNIESLTLEAYEYNSTGYQKYKSISYNTETYGIVLKLEEGKTYYFKFLNYNKGSKNITLKIEQGEHKDYPLALKFYVDNNVKSIKDGDNYYEYTNNGLYDETIPNDATRLTSDSTFSVSAGQTIYIRYHSYGVYDYTFRITN